MFFQQNKENTISSYLLDELLQIRAKYGDSEDVIKLLARGGNPNAITQDITAGEGVYTTPLIAAIQALNLDNLSDKEDQLPGKENYIHVIKLLLEKGADPNIMVKTKNGYSTALVEAARYGWVDGMKWLVENGARYDLVLEDQAGERRTVRDVVVGSISHLAVRKKLDIIHILPRNYVKSSPSLFTHVKENNTRGNALKGSSTIDIRYQKKASQQTSGSLPDCSENARKRLFVRTLSSYNPT